MSNRTAITYFVEVLPCPSRSMNAGDAGAQAEPLYKYSNGPYILGQNGGFLLLEKVTYAMTAFGGCTPTSAISAQLISRCIKARSQISSLPSMALAVITPARVWRRLP